MRRATRLRIFGHEKHETARKQRLMSGVSMPLFRGEIIAAAIMGEGYAPFTDT